uniref:Uncharacterized protein n=1 Tax=Globisporangium ultimum (strain ATCC 200006 / CBS 805.95 / DAOM BR144) TaxID=431595 RepID=K3X6F6_GLOUD
MSLSLSVVSLLLLLLSVIASTTTCTAIEDDAGAVTRGWSLVAISNTSMDLLDKTLKNESSYQYADIAMRLCLATTPNEVYQQVVSGVIHEFRGPACQVNTTEEAGACASPPETYAMCAEYAIRIYEQVWTNTTRVMSIELSSGLPSPTEHSNNNRSSSSSDGSVADEAALDNVELIAASDAEDFEIEYLSTPPPESVISTKEISTAKAPSVHAAAMILLICFIASLYLLR